MNKEIMKVSDGLLNLTNKFLQDFFDICEKENPKDKRSDSFHFNFTLADAIAQSNYPSKKENYSLLMAMSSFDDSIAKNFMNNRCQGFVKLIENRIANIEDQEDFIVENIKTTEFLADDFKIKSHRNDNGEIVLKSVECKTKAMDTSFQVRNNKNNFSGLVVIHKEWGDEFVNENEWVEKFIIKSVDFYCGKQNIMTIQYRFDYDNYKYYEDVSFQHYKYISDINSFYYILALT